VLPDPVRAEVDVDGSVCQHMRSLEGNRTAKLLHARRPQDVLGQIRTLLFQSILDGDFILPLPLRLHVLLDEVSDSRVVFPILDYLGREDRVLIHVIHLRAGGARNRRQLLFARDPRLQDGSLPRRDRVVDHSELRLRALPVSERQRRIIDSVFLAYLVRHLDGGRDALFLVVQLQRRPVQGRHRKALVPELRRLLSGLFDFGTLDYS